MPDFTALALPGAKTLAANAKTALANSVLHLYKQGLNPTISTPLADFTANECDFDGYAAITIVAWADPIVAGNGYVLLAPEEIFRWAHVADDVQNSVGGWYLVLAGGTLYAYGVFDPARSAAGADQAIVVAAADQFPAG